MDSPQEFKKGHISISTFKPSKEKSAIIHENINSLNIESIIKRSVSYVIPKRFVPKLKPLKNSVNPTFFLLDEQKKDEINENAEIKSEINDEDLSFSSVSDSFSIEEEKISDKLTDLDEHDINSKINCTKNKKIKDSNIPILPSPLFNLRKKLQRIKYNSGRISVNENVVSKSGFYKMQKKYSLNDDSKCYDDKFNLNSKKDSLNNEFYNFGKCKSNSLYYSSNNYKDKSKGHKIIRPFLIYDVLIGASQNNNNL